MQAYDILKFNTEEPLFGGVKIRFKATSRIIYNEKLLCKE